MDGDFQSLSSGEHELQSIRETNNVDGELQSQSFGEQIGGYHQADVANADTEYITQTDIKLCK